MSTHATHLRTLAALSLVALLPLAARAQRGADRPDPRAPDVWIESGAVLGRGEATRLGIAAPRSSYVTVLRVDTDGDMNVIYPALPNGRSKVPPSGQTILPFRGDAAPGVGYVFSIAADAPFDYRAYRDRYGRWAIGGIGRDGGVDPFELVDRFARRTTGRSGYSVGYTTYRVGNPVARDGRGDARHPGVYYGDGASPYGGYADGYSYPGSGYGNGYGNGYADGYGWWGGPGWDGHANDTWRYRRHGSRYGGSRYRGNAYDRDPRSRYDRHCADGTLVPYTVPCPRERTRPVTPPLAPVPTPRPVPPIPTRTSP